MQLLKDPNPNPKGVILIEFVRIRNFLKQIKNLPVCLTVHNELCLIILDTMRKNSRYTEIHTFNPLIFIVC